MYRHYSTQRIVFNLSIYLSIPSIQAECDTKSVLSAVRPVLIQSFPFLEQFALLFSNS